MQDKFNQLPSNRQTMTSLEISELTGKNHSDVLRAIRNMEDAWEKVAKSKFTFSEYKDSTGRSLPMCILDKRECLYVSTKFNDEARAMVIIRWEELERKEQKSQNAFTSEAVYQATIDRKRKSTRHQLAIRKSQVKELENELSMLDAAPQICIGCGKMVRGVKGLATHSRFCEGTKSLSLFEKGENNG